MLLVTPRNDQQLVIDGRNRVTIVSVQGDRVRVAVTAPKDVASTATRSAGGSRRKLTTDRTGLVTRRQT